MELHVPSSSYRTVRDKSTARELAAYVRDPGRYKPLVIITDGLVPGRKCYPADLAAAELGDRAEVWWVPGVVQRDLSALMDGRRVYAGAARIIWPLEDGQPDQFFGAPSTEGAAKTGVAYMAAAFGMPSTVDDPDPELDELRCALAKAEAKSADLSGKLAAARKKAAAMTTVETDEPIVFADPGEQFRHEVWLTYLRIVAEPERDTWELRDFGFGPDWFGSLGSADRRKIVAVVVEILTRRATEIPGRQVRQHHLGRSGSSPVLVRDDGATAWRANLQTNSPSARRILWWERTDGVAELGRVVLHDDDKLR